MRNADLEVTRFSIAPEHMDTRRCQSKMAIERDLGQSGRTASVDVSDVRNTCVRLANNSEATRFTRRTLIKTGVSLCGEHGE